MEEPDAYEEEEAPRVMIKRGSGLQRMMSSEDVTERATRLAEWEEQLLEYNDQLTEDGWTAWKKGAVTSVMVELQRKVMPDAWRAEVSHLQQRIASFEDQVNQAGLKESGLLSRIEMLERGPGCAAELREQIGGLEARLSQQSARERQRHVMAELLTSVADKPASAITGATAGRRRAASVFSRAEEVTRPGDTADEPPKPVESDLGPEVRARAASAQREAAELRVELDLVRARHDDELESLKAALESEKKAHRHAREALEQGHAMVGIHEAQEMSQLRIEVASLTEELEFLRTREEKVHAEEARLQMVSEMNKKLGANISRSELAALRTQVESLTLEANRVQEANQHLQAQLRSSAEAEAAVGQYGIANDRLEGALAESRRWAKSLEGKLDESRKLCGLLERQLVIRAAREPEGRTAPADSGAARGAASKPPGVVEASRRGPAMPLLWGPSDGGSGGIARFAGAQRLAQPVPTLKGGGGGGGGGGGAYAGPRIDGVAIAQRAIELHDELGAKAVKVSRVRPTPPLRPRRAPADATLPIAVNTNAAEIAAARARRDEGRVWEAKLAERLHAHESADSQEAMVLRANLAATTLALRTRALEGPVRLWPLLGLMRALRKWRLALELTGAYDAAVSAASAALGPAAGALSSRIEAAQGRAVKMLIDAPALLAPLGEMRRRLQASWREAQRLESELADMHAKAALTHPPLCGVPTDAFVAFSAIARRSDEENIAVPSRQPQGGHVAAKPMQADAADACAALDKERLACRLILARWRASWRRYRAMEEVVATGREQQAALERQLAAERAASAEQLHVAAVQLQAAEGSWRQEVIEVETQLAKARAREAAAGAEHAEEVGLLSTKLHQLADERNMLHDACEQHRADLKVLTEEVVRLHGAAAAADPLHPLH